MTLKCQRNKEGKCIDKNCTCVECMHGTCCCESFSMCGIMHAHTEKKLKQQKKPAWLEDA